LQISLSSRFDNQLLSAISFACAPISSNISRQAANRLSLWAVTAAKRAIFQELDNGAIILTRVMRREIDAAPGDVA
jgi:hypothetical protein